jgi:hypothetical protein
MTANLSNDLAPQFTPDLLCSCPHANTVITVSLDSHIPKDEQFAYQAQQSLLATMTEATKISTGWFGIKQAKMNRKGQLMLNVSPGYQMNVFAVTFDPNTEATSIYCFKCSKTKCKHRMIATDTDNSSEDLLKNLDTGADRSIVRKKTLRITPILASLVSVSKYPCKSYQLISVKIEQDAALAEHVVARRLNCTDWFQRTLKYNDNEGVDGIHFVPEKMSCCNEPVNGTLIHQEVWAITTQGILPMKGSIWRAQCQQCMATFFFDGREYGLVNFESRYMIDIGT